MRLTIVSPTDIMEGQLQTTRNAHLIKDPKQIVTNRVFTQIELLRDVTIGEAFRYQADNTFLSLRQQSWHFGASAIDPVD